jgi:hypothetical protein
MITDVELIDYKNTGFSFFTSFILIPGITIIFNIFGYVSQSLIYFDAFLMLFTFISYIRRLIFLKKHRRFISNKQYYFQNISFIILMIWNIISGFFVHKEIDSSGRSIISYYLIGEFNIALWIPLFIFSFILLGFMASTAKEVSTQMVKK